MSQFVAMLALCTTPHGITPRTDTVAVIEVNHFYDEQARLVFTQVIFWDWSEYHSRYQVRAWRLLKHPGQRPTRDCNSGGYIATWYDGDLLRVVRSVGIRETWTQYDPEIANRDILAKDRRPDLVPGEWPKIPSRESLAIHWDSPLSTAP